jgi:hypothetical protein
VGRGDQLIKLKDTTLDPDKPEAFLVWLGGAVALKSALFPDPLTVRLQLGQESPAFRARMKASKLFGRK